MQAVAVVVLPRASIEGRRRRAGGLGRGAHHGGGERRGLGEGGQVAQGKGEVHGLVHVDQGLVLLRGPAAAAGMSARDPLWAPGEQGEDAQAPARARGRLPRSSSSGIG